MKKKYVITFLPLVLILVGGIYYFLNGNPKAESVISDQATESKETQLSQSDIDSYKTTLKSAEIVHLRNVIDTYKNGGGVVLKEVVVNSEDQGGYKCGLDSFDKDYFKSKFFVVAVEGHLGGGNSDTIIFLDKPDRAFSAWLYPVSKDNWELRSFCENGKLSAEDIKNQFLIPLKSYLADPQFSI